MSFEELYETLLNAVKGHDSFTLNMVKTSKETYRAIYEHGAASRQAEVDELQKRIDEALKYVSESPLKDVSRKAMLNFLDILKGATP